MHAWSQPLPSFIHVNQSDWSHRANESIYINTSIVIKLTHCQELMPSLSSSISFLIFSPSHRPSLSLPSPPIVFLSHHILSPPRFLHILPLLLPPSYVYMYTFSPPPPPTLSLPPLLSPAHSSLTLHISPQLTILSYTNMYIIPLSLPPFLPSFSPNYTHLHVQQIQQYQNKQ